MPSKRLLLKQLRNFFGLDTGSLLILPPPPPLHMMLLWLLLSNCIKSGDELHLRKRIFCLIHLGFNVDVDVAVTVVVAVAVGVVVVIVSDNEDEGVIAHPLSDSAFDFFWELLL